MSKSELDQLWELQGRQAELRRHVMQLTSQLSNAERERSIIDITVREMEAMSDNTPVYMSVGKMFVLSPRTDLRSSLITSRNESLKRDDDHHTLRQQFVNKLKEGEVKIDELADQIEAARTRAAAPAPSGPGRA